MQTRQYVLRKAHPSHGRLYVTDDGRMTANLQNAARWNHPARAADALADRLSGNALTCGQVECYTIRPVKVVRHEVTVTELHP